MGAPPGVGAARDHTAAANNQMDAFPPELDENTSTTTNTMDACHVYLSLIQQYLSVFQVDNALWLSERCLADHPHCYEAVYLQALCYYRLGKIKNCHACLNRQRYNMNSYNNPTTSSISNACSQSTHNSLLFLSALCSMELGDFSAAETTLLQPTRLAYKQQQTRDSMNLSMDDWILQSTVSRFDVL